jgi:hypothetical protein
VLGRIVGAYLVNDLDIRFEDHDAFHRSS